MDWETGAITATDDLSFGALDVGDARFPAFDLWCSDMDTQVMVYSSHASTGTIGNPSLEGVWVPHGAWGGRAELHKLDSSGRILQFPLWSYDKNCNTWELCEPQCLHEGQGMAIAVVNCDDKGGGGGGADLPPTDPGMWENYSYPADLPGRLKEPRPKVHVMTLRELLALPLSKAVEYNLPWLVYRALYPHQRHDGDAGDDAASRSDGSDGDAAATNTVLGRTATSKAATAQSLLDWCARNGGLRVRARIAATLASCIPANARGLSALLGTVVVHEWCRHNNEGCHTGKDYFHHPDRYERS